jgi:taurine dioxygenase
MMSDYKHIEVKPLSGAIGAELFGVDISKPLDDDVVAEIRRAFLDHLVIFLRDQNLEPESQLAFARRFGEPMIYPFVKGLEAFPEVTPVIKKEEDKVNFGGLWHSDTTYEQIPPLGSMLYARQIPPVGGDTEFANMYLAYETLSEGMKRLLDPLIAVNMSGKGRVSNTRAAMRETAATDKTEDSYIAEHPAIRVHPETGRKALYVNGAHTTNFKGMSVEESAPILEFLFRHQIRPEFTCRFRWEVGSLAFWDNRCAQHNPLNDYHGYRREMHRVTLRGDKPV